MNSGDHMDSKPENKKKLRPNAIPALFNNSNESTIIYEPRHIESSPSGAITSSHSTLNNMLTINQNTAENIVEDSKPINSLIHVPQFELPANVALSSSAEIVKYNTVPSQMVNSNIYSNSEEVHVKNFVHNVIVSTRLWQVVQHTDDNILIALIQFKDFMGLEKKVVFKKNSLQPEISIDGRILTKSKYIMNETDLSELLDTLDDYEICFGNDGNNHPKCDGHYLMNASNMGMCCHCETLAEDDDIKKKSIAQKTRDILALYNEVRKLSNTPTDESE